MNWRKRKRLQSLEADDFLGSRFTWANVWVDVFYSENYETLDK
jgi:hypothetical protein